MPSLPSNFSLIVHAVALIAVFSAYGLCQEMILTRAYGSAEEHFTSSSLLILCNRVFAIVTGLALVLVTSGMRGDWASVGSRLRPSGAWTSYALVAVFNFLSTTCQYEALKYVSYTTSALAKCSKMVPVLVISAGLFKRKHQQKDWVAAAVIVAGCATYLFSAPLMDASPATTTHTAIEGVLGAVLLAGYLAFDGLTSTFQERMFGKNDNSADPFGPKSPVLDQLIWTNVFSALLSLIAAVGSETATGSVMPSLRLLINNSALGWDVWTLSAASSFGVIILLNTIASFGALQASLIMSIRQFVSILTNATFLGTGSSISIEGWCGIGWVASAVWIKIFGPTEAVPEITFDQEKEYCALGQSASAPSSPRHATFTYAEPSMTGRQAVRIYLAPLFVPLAGALVMGVFTLGGAGGVGGVNLLGGSWDRQLFASVQPVCPAEVRAVPYAGASKLRTGFVSYPRSGNSYIRGLIERVSYQTTSVYCDRALEQTFHGECDVDSGFFIKDHNYGTWDLSYHERYDQVVHVLRNPLDAVHSYWNLIEAMTKSYDDEHPEGRPIDHTFKAKTEPLGTGPNAEKERSDVLALARDWAWHSTYWKEAPLRTHFLRYEDLTEQPVTHLLGMLSFILPREELPAIDKVVCVAQENAHAEAYHSAKVRTFSSWDKYEPTLRRELLEIVKAPFCEHGYARMLEAVLGDSAGMAGFCDGAVAFPPGFRMPVEAEAEVAEVWTGDE